MDDEDVKKKLKRIEINEKALEEPEALTVNEMIVKHGDFVKKHSPYAKPRALIFTPERPPLLKKASTLTEEDSPDRGKLDRIIASQFSQNQENSNLRQIYNSKANSIKDFINYRLRKFQPAKFSTRPQVRVAKELKGDGSQMSKVAPRMKGVQDPPAVTVNESREHSPLPEHKTPVDLRKIEKYLCKQNMPVPRNVTHLAEHHRVPVNKESRGGGLPILFEARHEPS